MWNALAVLCLSLAVGAVWGVLAVEIIKLAL